MTIEISDQTWTEIFDEYATTTATIESIAKKHSISFPTIWRKINAPELSDRYTRARELKLEYLVSKLTELEEECKNITLDDSIDGKSKNAIVQAYKLQMDNIKWITSRLIARYNDKINQHISGSDGKALEVVFGVPAKKLPGENEAAGSSIQSSKSVSD